MSRNIQEILEVIDERYDFVDALSIKIMLDSYYKLAKCTPESALLLAQVDMAETKEQLKNDR